MNKQTSKLKTTATIILLLLMATVTFMAMPTKAQSSLPSGVTPTNLQTGGSATLPSGVTASETIYIRAFLSISPNPIGVNQDVLINVWIVPPLHVSRYFTGYTITITKPDGTQDVKTLNSFAGDATAYLEYPVDQVGNYSFQFDFPGGYFPSGNYTIAPGSALYSASTVTYVNFQQDCYYKPSSTPVQNLTVQQDQVMSWYSPLPTDYWTQPISPNNREWWVIAGNYPATGYVGGGPIWDQLYPGNNPAWSNNYAFIPWVQAPNSAHVLWRQLEAVDGLIGGSPAGQYSQLDSVSTPSVIYAGRCYQTVTKTTTQLINGTYRSLPGSVAECYDLQTGKIYYDIPTTDGGVTPNIIAYTSTYSTISGKPAVPGGTAGASVSTELISISNGYLLKINPYSGAITTNVSISPLTGSGGTYYMNEYVLYVQNLGGGNYRLINWTTAGTNTNFADRIISNTTYPRSSLPSLIDYNVGIGATVSAVSDSTTGVANQIIITGYKLTTGEMLWNKTVPVNQYSASTDIADHGILAVLTEKGYFLGFDLATGAQVWQSDEMTYPWSASSFGGYTIQSAYGLFFREGYDGVYAFNWTDGKIAWKFEETAPPFETPYTNENGSSVYSFSFNSGGSSGMQIADGKLYTYTDEHTPSLPITRGWTLNCVNITNGEGMWNFTGYWSPGGISDGYLTAGNMYDGYMYVIGKGPSITTVSAPQIQITVGQNAIISGTVLDNSPGQPGTPCISDSSMSAWMNYLYQQAPIPNAQGVPVSIDAIDPNGNPVHIGDATSDMSGTYAFTWTPAISGNYQITATFAGSNSYGSSYAETHANVVNAPTVTNTPTSAPLKT